MQPTSQDLPRSIGFFGAAGIMIGVTIGSGIFRTPSSIADSLGSPSIIILLWVIGGILSLFGALTFTELAVMFPRSGGIYNFLREGFGRRVAFTFGWSYMLLIKPFAAAAIAVVTIEYLATMLNISLTPGMLAGAVCVELILLTALNSAGLRLGASIGTFLTGLKLLALATIVVLAVVLPGGAFENLRVAPANVPLLTGIVAAMSAVLWSYDGWSDVGSVAGEVKEPQRTLPRVYLIGTLAVIALYVAVNLAYIYVLPLEQMRPENENDQVAVAAKVLDILCGPRGGFIVSGMIVLSTLGATHASIITGARVTFAQAQDGLLYKFLAKTSADRKTPIVALWSQCLLSCTAVTALRGFQSLADGFVFTMWIFYGLGAASLFVLRARRPEAHRSFKCPGYPLVPALFILSSATMTALSIASSPWSTLPWLGVLLLGGPAYEIWIRVRKDSARAM